MRLYVTLSSLSKIESKHNSILELRKAHINNLVLSSWRVNFCCCHKDRENTTHKVEAIHIEVLQKDHAPKYCMTRSPS